MGGTPPAANGAANSAIDANTPRLKCGTVLWLFHTFVRFDSSAAVASAQASALTVFVWSKLSRGRKIGAPSDAAEVGHLGAALTREIADATHLLNVKSDHDSATAAGPGPD